MSTAQLASSHSRSETVVYLTRSAKVKRCIGLFANSAMCSLVTASVCICLTAGGRLRNALNSFLLKVEVEKPFRETIGLLTANIAI